MSAFWALDTSNVWHFYDRGTTASCGYTTNGEMLNGPRPAPPRGDDYEGICPSCSSTQLRQLAQAPAVEVRACEFCGFETECSDVAVHVPVHNVAAVRQQWLCKLCHETRTNDLKRVVCYVGNMILAEVRRLSLDRRGPYR